VSTVLIEAFDVTANDENEHCTDTANAKIIDMHRAGVPTKGFLRG
jgi:hypothetical protein